MPSSLASATSGITVAATHLTVAPWLAARLAEVEAQDRDDTTLEDWLRGLLNALAEASQQRRTEDNARRDPW